MAAATTADSWMSTTRAKKRSSPSPRCWSPAGEEAILVDAQFGKSQAEKVVEKIRASGKKLTTIYISHGDPDYYFGLETIKAVFPDAKVVATPPTVDHIKETMAANWRSGARSSAPTRRRRLSCPTC